MNRKKDIQKLNTFPLKLIVLLAPFLIGIYYEFTSCILSIALAVYLCYVSQKRGRLNFYGNIVFNSILIIVGGYLVTSIWAVDSGLAVMGFIKFIPLLLFATIASQLNDDERRELCGNLPHSAAIMTVLSFVLKFIPQLSKYFVVAGRLAGFFQYSNTFALFLLVALIVLVLNKKFNAVAIGEICVLIFGIFESGSRTVFVLFILTAIALSFITKNKAFRIALPSLMVLGIAVGVIYVLVTNNTATIGRFLTTSLSESTFLGRLLYYKDALPIILKNPFGLGYWGYYFKQQEFQTGLYAVRYIHNDFLQILLDIGWVPAITFIAAIIKSVFSKQTTWSERLIILVICAHCMFDFDLQYVSIFIILTACFKFDYGKRNVLVFKKSAKGAFAAGAVVALVCCYFGVVSLAQYLNNYDLACKLYPWDTYSQCQLMIAQNDIEKSNEVADKIIAQNKSVAIAYSVKARYFYSIGDIEKFIEYKNTVFEKAPYGIEEFEDYAVKLIAARQAYEKAGDTASAEFCDKELCAIPDKLSRTKQNTDPLAWKIADKPKLELSDETENIISEIKRETEGINDY